MDNSEDLKMFWPVASHGSVLVTARNLVPSFSPAESTLKVAPFSNVEGSELLLNILEKSGEISSPRPNSLKENASMLSDELGGLPLAIAQTAGYILTVQCSLDEFRSVYEEQRRKGQSLPLPLGSVDMSYSHTLSTVWDITFERMDGEASFILNMLAFLDPDSTPECIFIVDHPEIIRHHPLFPRSKA